MHSFVYFLASKIDGAAAVKIGVSWKPSLRAVAIKREVGCEVEVLANIPYAGHYEALQAEKALHAKFASFRIRGEWFEPSAELIDEAQRATRFEIDPWPMGGFRG